MGVRVVERLRNLNRSGKAALLVLTLCVLGILYLSMSLIYKQENCQANFNIECAISQSAPLLESNNYSELAPVITRIQGIKDYQFSPDLNVIVLEYALFVGDVELAQKHHQLLKNSFDDDVGYNEKLINAKTPDEYQPRLAFVKEQMDEARKNLFGVPKDEQ